MRDIDANVLTQLAGTQLIPFILMEMYLVGEYYRYTDCDVNIVWQGKKFESRGIRVNDIQYSLSQFVSEVNVEIDDLDYLLLPTFITSEVQGSSFSLRLVVLNSSFAIIGTPFVLFDGILDTWTMDEGKLSITVTSKFNQWTQKTTSYHPASCRWKVFKGTECQYAGAASWCDRSYSRCGALSNTINFGGFRWLPSLMANYEVWWGPRPKKD